MHVVKAIVNKVKAVEPCVFTEIPADVRALHFLVRRVVTECHEGGIVVAQADGSEVKVEVRERDIAWYIKVIKIMYHLRDTDSDFLDGLRGEVEALHSAGLVT
jgi:hypothetical protein